MMKVWFRNVKNFKAFYNAYSVSHQHLLLARYSIHISLSFPSIDVIDLPSGIDVTDS